MEDTHIRIERFPDASFFITGLFQRAFSQPPPTFPVNYVAFYKLEHDIFKPIGYIHMTECTDYALVGGLCVDVEYRHKGLGEALLRYVDKDIGEKKGFFVSTNDPRIASRCGYGLTEEKHIMVKWAKRISAEEQERLISEVSKIGPF